MEVFHKETDAGGTVRKGKLEKKEVTVDAWVEKKGTTAKDLGQLFSFTARQMPSRNGDRLPRLWNWYPMQSL